MAILFALILFCGGLFIIIKGGDILVSAALRLNKITGINQIVIGATFISIATTLPEVFVSVFAVLAGNHGIAVGNAIGAMICNVALVMALYLARQPSVVKRGEILGKSLFLICITVIVILFASNQRLSGAESIVLLAVFFVFFMFNVWEARIREKQDLTLLQPCLDVGFEEVFCKRTEIRKIIVGFLAGQVALVIGAFLLVTYGERLAILLGASETVVGLTVIAIGTSMPELVTCITSIRKKSGGLALGNVFGANIFNCTLLLGASGLVATLKGGALPISKDLLFISLPLLLITTLIAVIPMLLKKKSFKWQGYLLLSLYALYVVYLFIVQPT